MNEILIYRAIGTSEDEYSSEMFANQAAPGMTLRFNSPGGNVLEGMAMISRIEDSSEPVTGIIDGVAASMAAFVALSCDKLIMHPRAKMMLHLPRATANGDSKRLRELADQLDEMRNQFADIIAKKAGIPAEKATEVYLQPNVDVWLTAQQAKAAGLIDNIVGEPEQVPEAANADTLHEIYAKIIDTKKEKQMDKTKLIGLLGSQANADMTDDEVYALVDKAVKQNTDHLETIKGLKAKVKTMEDEKAEAQKTEVKALLEGAVEVKKITEKQRPNWEAMFDKDFTNAKALLDTMQAPQTIKGSVNTDEPTEAELVAAWDEADRKGKLKEIKATDVEKYKAMFKAKFGQEPKM